MRGALFLGLALVLAVTVTILGDRGSAGVASLSLPAIAIVPLDLDSRTTTTDDTVADTREVLAGVAGANALGDPPGYLRIPKPKLPPGPRRVGIQAGHWLTAEAPTELGRIVYQTGTSWEGVTEWETNLDIARRVAALLRGKGLIADVLPTTIPPGYVADAFVALHSDGDGTGEHSGFKMAHGSRRGLYEDALQNAITAEYAAATGLEEDTVHVSRAMVGYYAFGWSRFQHALSPHTPAVILEMGYLSNDDDRELLVDEPDRLAGAIAVGIVRFLDAHPRSEIFGQDLLISPAPIFRSPSPSPPAQP